MTKSTPKPFTRVVAHATGNQLAKNHSSSLGENVVGRLMKDKEKPMRDLLITKGWAKGLNKKIDTHMDHDQHKTQENKRSPS